MLKIETSNKLKKKEACEMGRDLEEKRRKEERLGVHSEMAHPTPSSQYCRVKLLLPPLPQLVFVSRMYATTHL